MSPTLKKVNIVFMARLGPDEQGSLFHKPGTEYLILPQMKDKFEKSLYPSLKYFVRDIRDMIECYIRYHGPEHNVARKCENFETVMQQRLALLPR